MKKNNIVFINKMDYYNISVDHKLRIIELKHKKNDLLHSEEDKPAYICLDFNHKVREIGWYDEGTLHRLLGPAKIDIYKKVWYIKGKIHRDNGAAMIGKTISYYYNNGERHRIGGSSVGKGEELKIPTFEELNINITLPELDYGQPRIIHGGGPPPPCMNQFSEKVKYPHNFFLKYSDDIILNDEYHIYGKKYDCIQYLKIMRFMEKKFKTKIIKILNKLIDNADRAGTVIYNNRMIESMNESISIGFVIA